jgi:hypothetical protein
MRYRLSLVPLLGLMLLTVVAFTHANPGDQTWQPGVYDDADFDDVIALIGSWSGTTPDSGARFPQRCHAAAATIVPPEAGDLPTRLLRPDDTRSPPSS